jgi:kumamolisin
MKAMQPILQSLVAAGVNIFSASGDGGIYDCSSSLLGLGGGGGLLGGGKSTDVDFPASSPWVIGVGGTRLMSVTSPSTTNNGHNWSETAWGCVSSSDCANNGGSGGGQSSTFKAPGYQTRFVTNAPFRGRTGRMVPDIAANADSGTGFLTTTSSNGKEQVAQVGGTSLAAPVSAALFVDLLASLGRTRGVGDLHGGLYRAYSTHHAIRDIHSGSNGAAGDSPNDPSTSAAFGYDTVTGIGAVLWSGLSGFLPA